MRQNRQNSKKWLEKQVAIKRSFIAFSFPTGSNKKSEKTNGFPLFLLVMGYIQTIYNKDANLDFAVCRSIATIYDLLDICYL